MRRPPQRSATDLRRAWPALLAALAILLQGLIPAAAVAADHTPGAWHVAICTPQGLKTVDIDPSGDHKHGRFGGLACEQCVMASFAGVAAEPPALIPSVTEAEIQPTDPVFLGVRPSDAAPLPPARGPPTLS